MTKFTKMVGNEILNLEAVESKHVLISIQNINTGARSGKRIPLKQRGNEKVFVYKRQLMEVSEFWSE